MPRIVQKDISFPLAGVSRQVGHEREPPYSTPVAWNVRGTGPIERRHRGGSRPGLAKASQTQTAGISSIVPVVKTDGTRALVIVADGTLNVLDGTEIQAVNARIFIGENHIITDDDMVLVFDTSLATSSPVATAGAHTATTRAGMVYLADGELRMFNPVSGHAEEVVGAPTGCPIVALYRDRLILAGKDSLYYASRQSDPLDWNFGADMADNSRAVAGQLEIAGRIGETITAIIPVRDRVCYFATAHTLWRLEGDPADGTLSMLSDSIGVVSHSAWAMTPQGQVAFLSSDGIYYIGGEEGLQRVSARVVPDSLRGISPEGNRITMAYDVRGRGFCLFVTPLSGTGEHWWIDIDTQSLWPVAFHEDHEPVSVARINGDEPFPDLLLGCRDGYIRRFSDSVSSDDGEPLRSAVVLGPFRASQGMSQDAVLNELHGAISGADVQWAVIAGNSAEQVADDANTAVEMMMGGGSFVGDYSGTFVNGRNRVFRPRVRGPWAAVCLYSEGQWAFEAMQARINQLGRMRDGN